MSEKRAPYSLLVYDGFQTEYIDHPDATTHTSLDDALWGALELSESLYEGEVVELGNESNPYEVYIVGPDGSRITPL